MNGTTTAMAIARKIQRLSIWSSFSIPAIGASEQPNSRHSG